MFNQQLLWIILQSEPLQNYHFSIQMKPSTINFSYPCINQIILKLKRFLFPITIYKVMHSKSNKILYTILLGNLGHWKIFFNSNWNLNTNQISNQKKVNSPKFWLLWDEGGGGLDVQIFPKFKWLKYGSNFDAIRVTYLWDIGNIWYTDGWYMIKIVLMYWLDTVCPKGPVKKYLPIALATKQPITDVILSIRLGHLDI